MLELFVAVQNQKVLIYYMYLFTVPSNGNSLKNNTHAENLNCLPFGILFSGEISHQQAEYRKIRYTVVSLYWIMNHKHVFKNEFLPDHQF